MRFTEHEMTVGVDAVARRLFIATRPPWRRGDAAAAYEALGRAETYPRKVAAGEIVLPVLTALPERPTVGARPEFSAAEYEAAAEAGSRQLLEHRRPEAWDAMSPRKRRRLVAAAAELTRVAVAAMPVRQDPDALVVPDHL
ncbi:hypothetical protein [Nocardioides sp. cx-173]|uniref:hypothetical protein n=1 Tax=Nocardioides sp. cx-173 TaxID=2898796 RepID=UPI001E526208|nr:hypothetical protein [Nocardioides sp. cx-173]MCD4526770.1 hypothetical protein [Nocardioides sp. cx-173]UGB43876.1 hypothetical protein LQ940_10245 [Nocardioides sp. cx-173]